MLDLKESLRLHELWLKEEEGGIRLDLSGKDLSNADLRGANLRYADLRNADLRNADLRNADLRNADLRNADLSNADLRGADLRGADLRNADLSNANLRWCIGNSVELKTLQLGKYRVTYSKDIMAIGCKQYTIEEWKSFDNETIEAMDTGALAWWNKHKEQLL